MDTYTLSLLMYALCGAVSLGWAKLWLHICSKGNPVIRNIVMIILSLGVVYIAAQIVFLPVDETYSYSNICAQGLYLLMFLQLFTPVCVITLIISVCRAIMRHRTGDENGAER